MTRYLSWLCAAGLSLSIILSACGGEDGSALAGLEPPAPAPPPAAPPAPPPPEPPPAAKPANVEASLNSLGVDTHASPRRDSDGLPYPATFSPFGMRFTMAERADGEVVMGRYSELILAGFSLEGSSSTAHISVIDDLVLPGSGPPTNVVDPVVLYQDDDSPWVRELRDQNSLPTTLRDAVAADVDGDGVEEIAFVFMEGGLVRLRITKMGASGSSESERVVPVPLAVFPIGDLRIAAGDFDMDGADELAIAVSPTPHAAPVDIRILIIEDEEEGYAVLEELILAPARANRSVSVVLETGNLDYDAPSELAIVVNEIQGSGTTTQVATRFHVFDDAANEFDELAAGPITTTIAGVAKTAVVADAAIADLDGDQAGELLLAGLTAIVRTCSPENAETFVEHILVVLDDAVRTFQPWASSVSVVSSPQECSDNAWLQRFVHVNALDVDGDSDLEIQVNAFVFDSIPAPGVLWDNIPAVRRLSSSVLLLSDNGDEFDRGKSSMVTADIDGNGREEIVAYRQGNVEIEVFGVDDEREFRRLYRVPVEADVTARPTNPILVALDPDRDSQVLQFQNDYQLVFTEAVVLAALAAPPCGIGIGQNTDDCTTTWGRFRSIGAENERELEFSAGIGVGFKVQGGALTQTDAKSKITLSGALTTKTGSAYELKRGESFTTGPLEDSVVFFSIPMDKYTYRVISHPDPARVGTEIVVGLPRSPVVRMATLAYYNSHVPEGAVTLENVFQHTPGDIGSYMDVAQKNVLLDQKESQLDDVRRASANDFSVTRGIQHFPVFDPLEAERGLETEMVGVGQGAGSTELSLEVSEENSAARALKFGAEFETQTTIIGIVFDLKFGFSATWTTNMTMGAGTSYVGTVGSIDAEHFEREQYNFGLFTYLNSVPDRYAEYQVIEYYVEGR